MYEMDIPKYVPIAYPIKPIIMPLMRTFLLPMAPTIGGINGGEHISATWATVNKSPLTLQKRDIIKCMVIDATIT